MTKVSESRFRKGIKKIAENAYERVPRWGSEGYMLKINDAEEGVPEGRVINDLEETGFATVNSVKVESIVPESNGEAVMINGDISISLLDEEIPISERFFLNKDEAVQAWEFFMREKLAVITKKFNAYQNLKGFVEGLISKGAY